MREQPSTNKCNSCDIGSACRAWGAARSGQETSELGVG